MPLTVDTAQALEFFSAAYPKPWPGVLHIDIIERWIDNNGKKKTRVKLQKQIPSFEHLENFFSEIQALNLMQDQGYNFFFSNALFDGSGIRKKENVTAITHLWADVDHVNEEEMKSRLENIPIHPTGIVRSGDGYHIYWKLETYTEPDPQIEIALRRVRDWVKAPPGTTDITRLLRIPGTWNCKSEYGEPRQCKLEWWNKARTYKLTEFLDKKITYTEINLPEEFKTRYIVNGELLGDKTRSERDYAVIKELLIAGHTKEQIIEIFTNPLFQCSSKALEKGTHTENYIKHTIKKAMDVIGSNKVGAIYDSDNSVWKKKVTSNGSVITEQLSNFCIEPKKIINMVNQVEGAANSLVEIDIKFKNTTKNIIIDALKLLKPDRFLDFMQIPGMVWLGSGNDWLHYTKNLFEMKIEEESASDVVGWYKDSFVLPHITFFNPIVHYVKNSSEAPIFFEAKTTGNDLNYNAEELMRRIPHYAKELRPQIIYPTVSWILASMFATKVREAYVQQFPLLCLEGQQGSGKTTSAMSFVEILCGVKHRHSRATTLAILRRVMSGTNAIPVFIDEYEHDEKDVKTNPLNELLRLSYQAGYAQKTNLKTLDVDIAQLVSPIILTTTRGIVDEALADRTYVIRCPKLPKRLSGTELTSAEKALIELDDEHRGTNFLHWWLQQDPIWIDDIQKYKRRISATDRQQLAFAVPTAVMMYCAKQFNWPITIDDAISFWEGTHRVAIEPLEILDICINHLAHTRIILPDRNYAIKDGQFRMSRTQFIDMILEHSTKLDLGQPIGRKWLEKTMEEAVKMNQIVATNKITTIDGIATRCVVLDLSWFPKTAEFLGHLII